MLGLGAKLGSHVSYGLNSSKRGSIGDYIRECYRVIKGGARNLDHNPKP